MEINEKYKELYTSTNRYFVITGGRGSGKSFAVADFLLRLSFEAGHVILFTRYTLKSAYISIIPEFLEKIDNYGIMPFFSVTRDSITNTKTGSSILFRGIKTSSGNQTANLKSIQGITTWVLDEAEELTDEKIFDKIDDSIRTKTHQNRVILVLNPTTAEHWIYRRFFDGGLIMGVTYIHTTYLDNLKNLSKSFIEKAERVRELNPKVYKHRYLGAWIDRPENAIFQQWTIGDFDFSLPLQCYGQDFGFSNDPTTLIRIAVEKRQRKIYLHECYYQKYLTTSQIAQLNREFAGDQTIVADCSEPRLISELQAQGLKMVKSNAESKQRVAGALKIMQDYEIIVTQESLNLQKELRNYVWLVNEIPIDDYNHAIDAAKYAFFFLVGRGSGVYSVI